MVVKAIEKQEKIPFCAKEMSDNDVIVFKNLQRSRCSEPGKHKLLEDGFDPSFVVSASKRARVLPEFVNLQNGGFAGCTRGSSPLGLKLELTHSFLDLVHKKLCKGKQQVHFPSHQNQGLYLKDRPKTKLAAAGSSRQKLKASNFAALLLQIGSWQRQSLDEEGLKAKFYYAKRRIVWEVLEGALKSKIEIEWPDITAIRASMADTDEPGILEIQLAKQPLFFRESNPEPRRHTSWIPVPDFTGGQATIIRRHLLVFPPGVLDRHYEQLLKCDKRLFALSQVPFPYQECPLFNSNLSGPPQHSLSLTGRELGFESMFIRPSTNSAAPPADNNLPVGIQEPVQVMNQWQVDINARTQSHEPLSYQDYRTNLSKLENSENNFSWNNGQVPCPNEGTGLDAEVDAMFQYYLDLEGEDLDTKNQIETYMARQTITSSGYHLEPNKGLVMEGLGE